jgi:hypothetical protein
MFAGVDFQKGTQNLNLTVVDIYCDELFNILLDCSIKRW